MRRAKGAMKLSSLFTQEPNLIYLNTGSLARTPTRVLDKVIAEFRLAELNPTKYLYDAWERMWTNQCALARMLKARPQDLYLRPNVTIAMNDFLMNIKIPPGAEILVSDLEYGAIVNICRRRTESDGLKLRTLTLPYGEEIAKTLTPDQLHHEIVKQIRPETKLLMLSHIITGNGMILPIKSIAAECRKRGLIFAIDGAHGPGALPLDFSEFRNGRCGFLWGKCA
jgi:isopenicillin-N epimerase